VLLSGTQDDLSCLLASHQRETSMLRGWEKHGHSHPCAASTNTSLQSRSYRHTHGVCTCGIVATTKHSLGAWASARGICSWGGLTRTTNFLEHVRLAAARQAGDRGPTNPARAHLAIWARGQVPNVQSSPPEPPTMHTGHGWLTGARLLCCTSNLTHQPA
jgi:hypothetical protein